MSMHTLNSAAFCLLVVASVTACAATPPDGKPADNEGYGKPNTFIDLSQWTPIEELPVDVFFLHNTPGDSESPLCPRFVNKPFIRLLDWVNKTYVEKVVWYAKKADGSPYRDGYSIYFSPFNRMEDGKTGVIKSTDIDDVILTLIRMPGYDVEFKYTVSGDDCRREPLDPRMRVD